MDPRVDSSLEYECIVTQFPQGDCCYVKWWDGGPISWTDLRQKDESGNTRVASKDATPVFPTFPVILVPRLDPLLVFDGPTIFCQRGTKNTGYAWLSPCYSLVTQPHGRLSNQWWSDYSDKERRLCELGGLEYLLNLCARLNTWLHPGLDPGVRSKLEYKCSVTSVAAQGSLV